MYADPQSVPIVGTATTFNRVPSPQPVRVGKFVDPSGNYTFEIKQDATKKRLRHEIRLSRQILATDPISSAVQSVSASAYLVVDEPSFGFTDTQCKELVENILDYLSDSSYGEDRIARLLTGQN